MNPWATYAIFLLGVAVFSALVAPWAFWAISAFADVRFHEVLNRLLLGTSILGAFWILHRENLLSCQTLGLARSRRFWRDLGLGAGIAIGSVVLVTVLGFAAGVVTWNLDESARRMIGVMATNLLVGAIVGVMEEVHFRGCLLGWLRQRTHAMLALALVTAHYSLAHFLSPPKVAKKIEVEWGSGFRMLGYYLEKHTMNFDWLAQCAMLVLIGLTVGWCFLRTSRLYLSIGLHAGWVFAGKSLTFLTDDVANQNAWFGAGKLIGSPVVILVLAGVFALMIWICNRPTAKDPGAG